jgi:hypothetical protein
MKYTYWLPMIFAIGIIYILNIYIDYEGNTMPLSDNYTARVPLISGENNLKNKKKFSFSKMKIFFKYAAQCDYLENLYLILF